jgi:multicomponent Na+:H+ antiporter subunit F
MIEAAMYFVVLPMLSIAILLTTARLMIGPSIGDRVVALDLINTMGIGVICAYAIATDQPAFLDIAILLALLGFLGTIAFAYYIERRA